MKIFFEPRRRASEAMRDSAIEREEREERRNYIIEYLYLLSAFICVHPHSSAF